jgi:hypothetical protein
MAEQSNVKGRVRYADKGPTATLTAESNGKKYKFRATITARRVTVSLETDEARDILAAIATELSLSPVAKDEVKAAKLVLFRALEVLTSRFDKVI